MIRCESLLEFDALFLMEFARGILSFEEQPVSITYRLNGRARRYTPDFGIHWADGRRSFVEIKPAQKLAEPEVTEKFWEVERFFESCGDQFFILSDQQIRRPIRLEQIRRLLNHLVPNPVPAHQLRQMLPATGDVSIAAMCASGIDRQTVTQLLANRTLTCDLDSTICEDTKLRLFEEADDVQLFI